jgi:hypothetical protein
MVKSAADCGVIRGVFRIAPVAGLAAALTLIVSSGQSEASSNPWAKLRRPLHIPHIAPGSPCPITRGRSVSSNFATAQGRGPVYPVGAFPKLTFIYPPQPNQRWYGSAWSGQKVLWIARPNYRGPVLIRGRQLDGGHELRFGNDLDPGREMRLRSVGGSSPGGWQNRASSTRLRAPGCYAWQVDGTTFSRVIVFEAALAS